MNTERRQTPRDLPFSDPHCPVKARKVFAATWGWAGVLVAAGLLAGWLA